MNIAIKRLDNTLPFPEYKTTGAIAFDLYVRETTTIPAQSIGFLPNNIIMMIPEGYGLFVFSRSSTPKRLMISQPHGVGVIDSDYCGPTDEIKTMVYNLSNQEVVVERGDRVSQGIILPIPKVTFTEVENVASTSRGGFGTTTSGDLSMN